VVFSTQRSQCSTYSHASPSARVHFHEIIHRRLYDARYNNKCMQFLLLNHDTAAALHLTTSFGFQNNLFTHNIRTVLYSCRASELRHGSLSSSSFLNKKLQLRNWTHIIFLLYLQSFGTTTICLNYPYVATSVESVLVLLCGWLASKSERPCHPHVTHESTLCR
jgi:hypothetical protein